MEVLKVSKPTWLAKMLIVLPEGEPRLQATKRLVKSRSDSCFALKP